MKKLFAGVLILCLVIMSCVACGPSDVIRVSEVTHSVFYAPQYVAVALGYFEEEGLKIELSNAGGADKVMAALVSGGVEIGLCGPEQPIYVYSNGKADNAVVFGQLTKRDGAFLIGRQNISMEDFSFDMLIGKEILSGRRGGVPAMTLQYTLETTHHLTTNTTGKVAGQVYLNEGLDFNNLTVAFAEENGDFVTAFEPAASQLVADGYGYKVASIGQSSGLVPYTAYTCLKSYYNKNEVTLTKFLRAVDRGLQYIKTHTAEEVAEVIESQFESSLEMLTAAIQSYIDIDAWSETPVMAQADFERLQDIIERAGHLPARVDFESVVYNGYASTI